MSLYTTELRNAADRVLSEEGRSEEDVLSAMIRDRSLSRTMSALNVLLLGGTQEEQAQARAAIHKLGFAAD